MSRFLRASSHHGYFLAVATIALSTLVFLPGRDLFAKGQWALLYLLVILLVASGAGTGPAILAAVLAFFAWNFFFLPPYHTLLVHDPQDWLALAAFLVVGVIVGVQTGRMRAREAQASARERETALLNRLSAAVVTQATTRQMAESCLSELIGVLGAEAAVLYLPRDGALEAYSRAPTDAPPDGEDAGRAECAFREGPCGETQARRTDDGGICVPVQSISGTSGALTVRPRPDGPDYSTGEVRLVASLSNLIGAFLERERLQAEAGAAAAAREADRLKSSLLSSVSHELKTPLAALTATVTNLLEGDVAWDEQSVRDELRAIIADVSRLSSSIGALLELSRLEAHAWKPRMELYELSDVVAAAIDALPARFSGSVAVDLPEESPVVELDFEQMKRALQNLIENALVHGGDDVGVTVGAHEWHDGVRLWVEDDGPGIPADEREAVFEKFYRGRRNSEGSASGTGLGLAIAKEVVHAHAGSIALEDVTPHGARLVIVLPLMSSARQAPATEDP